MKVFKVNRKNSKGLVVMIGKLLVFLEIKKGLLPIGLEFSYQNLPVEEVEKRVRILNENA